MRKLEVRRATGWKAHASRIRHLTNTRLSFGPGHRNNTVPFDLQVLSLVYRRSVTRHFFHINYGQNNPHCLAPVQWRRPLHWCGCEYRTYYTHLPRSSWSFPNEKIRTFTWSRGWKCPWLREFESELLSGVGGENASCFISSNRNFYLKSGVKMPPVS